MPQLVYSSVALRICGNLSGGKDEAMSDKRKYTDVVSNIETHIIYINSHLQNIDTHLERINDTNLKQEVKIVRNKDRISLGYRMGGGLLTLMVSGTIALLLKLMGVY